MDSWDSLLCFSNCIVSGYLGFFLKNKNCIVCFAKYVGSGVYFCCGDWL
jgi:hypothetical protein